MSVNKYKPHLLILPEDDANRQIANGFELHDTVHSRAMQVLEVAGGWMEVRETFASVHMAEMRRHRERHMVLLVDFDDQAERLTEMRRAIPEDLSDRVYVLGVWSEPERLKNGSLGNSLEDIGQSLAQACYDQDIASWNHPLLKHNGEEVKRLMVSVRPILFIQS